MADVKGTIGRVIQSPGYHLAPKYDLPYLRGKLNSGGKRAFDAVLPLTSMIDMFSLLVIFLLLNFSATGEIFYVNNNLKIPIAEHGHVLESLPIISITPKGVIFDAQGAGSKRFHIEERDPNLPQLKSMLQRIRNMEQTVNRNPAFRGGVNIQADEKTSIIYVKRVMNILISEGWTNISFAVRPTRE